jgi:hypothetical protein
VDLIVLRLRPEHTIVLRPQPVPTGKPVPTASLQDAQRLQRAPKRSGPQLSVNMPGQLQRRVPKVEGTVQRLTQRLPVRRATQPNSVAGLKSTNTTSGSRFFRQQLEFFGSTRPVFA